MIVVGNTLYFVGDFGTVTGNAGVVTRKRAAAVDVTTGQVLGFNPNLSGKANAVAINPNGGTIYVGGNFLNVNGQARSYLAAVHPVSGQPRLNVDPTFQQVGDLILDISVSDDGAMVFGAAGGGFNSAAAWDAVTGRRVWTQRANGDVQAVRYSNGNVYFGFHDGFGGNVKLRLLAADAATGKSSRSFSRSRAVCPARSPSTPTAPTWSSEASSHGMGAIKVKGLSVHP